MGEKQLNADKTTLKTHKKRTPDIIGVPFKVGNPGGPGRPRIKELREGMLTQTPKLIERLRKMAQNGSPAAMRIWFDRVLPALQSLEVSDNREDTEENLSNLTDEQIKKIAEKEAEIAAIKAGGPAGAGNATQS